MINDIWYLAANQRLLSARGHSLIFNDNSTGQLFLKLISLSKGVIVTRINQRSEELPLIYNDKDIRIMFHFFITAFVINVIVVSIYQRHLSLYKFFLSKEKIPL